MRRALIALTSLAAATAPGVALAAPAPCPNDPVDLPDVCPESDLVTLTPGALVHWPAVERDVAEDQCLGAELTGLWNSFGETQKNTHLHSGLDLRTHVIDPNGRSDFLVAPANVDIWVPWKGIEGQDGGSVFSDTCENFSSCRLFLRNRGNARYVFYVGHVRIAQNSQIHQEVRDAIMDAAAEPLGSINTNNPICAGTKLAESGQFYSGVPHFHFTIFDTQDNFDAFNPLTYLRPPVVDGAPYHDELAPEILDWTFATCSEPAAGAQCVEIEKLEGCASITDPLSGAVDLVGITNDIYHQPADAGLNKGTDRVGVYAAEYRIRRVGSQGLTPLQPWYEFDRATLTCRGSVRGADCTNANLSHEPNGTFRDPVSEQDFVDLAVLNNHILGETFERYLYSIGNDPQDPLDSVTEYNGLFERHVSVLTHHWGLSTANGGNGLGEVTDWDTTDFDDGYYQVSLYVRDQAGNYAWRDRFVYVQNDGPIPTDSGDLIVRDNIKDTGALPSNPNGEKYWRSPSIKVVEQGAPAPVVWDEPAEPVTYTQGSMYDVYVRIENIGCDPVSAPVLELAIATPGIWSDWDLIATEPLVDPIAGGDTVVVGPISWQADADKHKCMLARIDSPDDPAQFAFQNIYTGAVAEDNNFGQLNLHPNNGTPFVIGNPDSVAHPVSLAFDCNDFPMYAPGASVSLTVPYLGVLATAWSGAPKSTLVDTGTELVLTFDACKVTMPPALLPPGTLLSATVTAQVPSNMLGTRLLDFSELVNGVTVGGISVVVGTLIPQ